MSLPQQQAGISGQELVKRGLVPGSLAEHRRDQQTRNGLRGERLLTSLEGHGVCGPEAFPASSLALILFALSFAFRSCFLRHSFPTIAHCSGSLPTPGIVCVTSAVTNLSEQDNMVQAKPTMGRAADGLRIENRLK